MNTDELIARSQEVYDERYKSELERTHRDYFVAIEPESGDYFLGTTLSDAAAAARVAWPNRRSAVFRVGHRATIYMGGQM